MKKSAPKLTLHRETLRSLEREALAAAAGGGTHTCNLTCLSCKTGCQTCTC